VTLLQKLRESYPYIGYDVWRKHALYDSSEAYDGAGHLLRLAEAVEVFLDTDHGIEAVVDLHTAFTPLRKKISGPSK
jgi:hypothetical protein